MATVYITKELEKQIERRIYRMRDREIELEVPNNEKTINVDASELLMQMAWRDHLHVFPQLPKDWLKKSAGQSFYVNFDMGEDGKYASRFAFDMGGLSNYYETPTAERWGAPRPECTKEWLESRLHLKGAQEILTQLTEKETRKTIHEKWEKVNNDIRVFLGKCKSLNEALRLWPSLQLYVPEEYIQRVNHKVERRKRETEIIETVDIEELTATAIAAKLAGAL